MEECCRAEEATDENMAHAHCALDTQGYKHTFVLCNTYCFSTATMAARTRLTVTLYVQCLSCYNEFPGLEKENYNLIMNAFLVKLMSKRIK